MRTLVVVVTFAAIAGIAALETEGPPKKEDVPKFISTLKTSPNAKARVQAVEDIGYRGAIRASDVDIAIDPILNALKNDKDAEVRVACARALGTIGTHSDKCVSPLTDALKDSTLAVKIAAAQALGQFGPEAQSALPALMELAKIKESKDEKKLSQAAVTAMKSIKGVEKKK
jgi:HEAT repeat protein